MTLEGPIAGDGPSGGGTGTVGSRSRIGGADGEPGGRAPHIGVVGAGILGTVLALRLAEGGARVTLLERAPTPGGLAGAFDFGGHRIDRFYHVIVPSDERMIALADQLGLSDRLSFTPVGVGFFVDGKMHPFNGIGDFLRFPPLSPLGRARLAWFVLHCQLRRDYDALERLPLERWLTRHCGRRVVQRIWRPLLDSRFNSHHDELPATYLWARTNRMRSARDSRSAGETMGCLRGGHEQLVLAAAERARELGVDVRLGAGVEGLVLEPAGTAGRGGNCGDGRGSVNSFETPPSAWEVAGVRVDGQDERFDLTIPTLQPPALRRLLPEELQPLLGAYPERHLGVVCLILKLRRSLTPYYSINICDPTPITTVVETSHVVGTEHTDGLRLAYLPKYCDPGSPEFAEDDETVYRRYTEMLAKLVPDFSHEDVVDWTVQRAPLVEPVHALDHEPRTAPIWPGVEGLALASASQIYPRLLNGESVVGLAERVAVEALERTRDRVHTEPARELVAHATAA
jgi:protoporphyrinogen oxidase